MTARVPAIDRPNERRTPELDRSMGSQPEARSGLAAGIGLTRVTRPGQQVDAAGQDDAAPGRRLLSVAEIQQALRELRARRPGTLAAEVAASPGPRRAGNGERPERDDSRRRRGTGGDNAPAFGPGRGEGGECAADWVTVVAAQPGAGASTVALALSDAASADRRVHLVESAPPARSGLLAAAAAELGTDATGAWRRGSRSRVTIDRRATDLAAGGWPTLPAGEGPAVTVVDLGLSAAADLVRLGAAGSGTVVVCRATLPGVRLTEQLLGRLSGQPVVVAAVGPRRWPGELTAGLGPLLRQLRDADRVVTVPTDRRLEITGLTPAPLPSSVLAAGRALWRLLDADHPHSTAGPASSASTAQGAQQ